MATDKPFDFEKWAVTRVPGMTANGKRVGDGGIDGRGHLPGHSVFTPPPCPGGRLGGG